MVTKCIPDCLVLRLMYVGSKLISPQNIKRLLSFYRIWTFRPKYYISIFLAFYKIKLWFLPNLLLRTNKIFQMKNANICCFYIMFLGLHEYIIMFCVSKWRCRGICRYVYFLLFISTKCNYRMETILHGTWNTLFSELGQFF